jgi:hypothetical protein
MGPLIRASPAINGNISAYGSHNWIADANSALPALLDSVAQFDYLGVPRTKIVMGVPWYGVDYACNASVPGANTPGGLCHAPCHAVLGCGHQLDYQQARALLDSNASLTGQNYDHTTASVFFDYECPPSNTTSTGYKCKIPGRHQVRNY